LLAIILIYLEWLALSNPREKMRKKLPIGIQTFDKIIEGNYCYVDKTEIAYNLIEGGSYYFLSRPRRFGKSLFLSTLRAIFEGKKDLFEGLYIYEKWNFESTYPVIAIDFGKGELTSKENIDETLRVKLLENAKRLGVEVLDTTILSLAFGSLIQAVQEKYNQKVVILIDEYDKPIIDNISDKEMAAVGRNALASFYSAIKSSDEYLKFVFMTGVSKFSKMNLFSTLNNLDDITLNKKYATLTGYTHQDLQDVFVDYLDGVDLEKVKRWYNGYNYFGEPIYNPFDILQFFGNENEFKNYWWQTGNTRFLFEMLAQKTFNVPQLENIVVSEQTLNTFEVDNIDLVALLWQTGYLTFDKKIDMPSGPQYKMKVPNLEIQASLNLLFAEHLTQMGATKSAKQFEIYEAILACDFKAFKQSLDSLFAAIPYNNHVNNTIANYEGYYASVVFAFLASIGFDLIPEDITNKGRIDLTIKTENSIFVIEFKVDEAEEAIKQIKEKCYFEKYIEDERSVYLVGVNFDSSKKQVSELVWEKA
jgi:hypothetical protein